MLKPKILIVDDIEENLLVLRKILNKLEVEVISATNGNDALSLTLYNDFALIILDVQMPEMSGYEVADLLKDEEKTASIPIIFVTAIDRNEAKELKGYDVGAVDFIFKPYNRFILLSKVKIFIDLYNMKTNLEEIVDAKTEELKEKNRLLSEEFKHHIKMSQEIKYVKNYLDNIIRSMPSALIAVNENYIITNWNLIAESLTGVLKKDALGKNLWEMYPDFKQYKHYCQEILENKTTTFLKNVQLQKDKYYNISIFSIYSDVTRGVVIRIDDITELRSNENQLVQAQKLETVGTLASGLAHDFNNVMSGITGTLSILEYKMKKFSNLTKEDLEKYLDIMNHASDKATDMVQQLLSLTRKKNLSLKPVDLNNIINHVIKIARSSFEKTVHIKTTLSEGKATILGDTNRLEQVILNFCVNAAHAMTIMRDKTENQGGDLSIRIIESKLPKHLEELHQNLANKKIWEIAITDTGVGIKNDILAKIFDPFFTTKEEGKGTGLGLSMAYNIIKQHDGIIDIKSEVGTGTTFYIYLPKTEEKVIEIIKAEEKELKKGDAFILLIDDEQIIHDLATEILTTCGYKVLNAFSGKKGIEIYEKRKDEIALVILDLIMPEMNGKQVYEKLKAINPKVKAILSSGYKNDKRVEETLKAGVGSFLQKPYTFESLSEIVYNVIHEEESDILS